ncbi:MAG TPA: hypothetical protein VNX02_14805 [Steroidobacteraceae bacterium]|jgi:hypothetical protein|nr:hypothetical protein [Steroidobacteraceae bacterium]
MRVITNVAAAAIVGVITGGLALGQAQRQEEVAARGAEVMPFRLSATTHVFTKTPAGGLQQVVAKNPGDSEQVRLIRMHLEDIATHFHQGDYSGPAQTHGERMPGLAQLRAAKPGEIRVLYTDVAAGGQIEYLAQRPELIAAIHEWFDAQLSDHGADAMAGHDHMAHP